MTIKLSSHVLSFNKKLFLSVISLFIAFAICFMAFQYRREKEYKIELLNTQLQNYNDRLNDFLRGRDTLNIQQLNDYVCEHTFEDLRVTLINKNGTVIYDNLEKEQKLKLLGEACSDAQWLNRMVENLLSVTRFDGGQVAVQKTPTVLDELIDTVLVRFQKRYPKVPVTTYLPDSFIVIPMDSMLISQVLTNLLENAAVHAEGMTQLTLRVFTLGSRAVFEVSDNLSLIHI